MCNPQEKDERQTMSDPAFAQFIRDQLTTQSQTILRLDAKIDTGFQSLQERVAQDVAQRTKSLEQMEDAYRSRVDEKLENIEEELGELNESGKETRKEIRALDKRLTVVETKWLFIGGLSIIIVPIIVTFLTRAIFPQKTNEQQSHQTSSAAVVPGVK